MWSGHRCCYRRCYRRGAYGLIFKKTPQLKQSIVADWLDTPGSVVKKTSAVPLEISMDAAESPVSGGADVPSPNARFTWLYSGRRSALTHYSLFFGTAGFFRPVQVSSIISLKGSLLALPRCSSIASMQSFLEIKVFSVFRLCISARLRSISFCSSSMQ